VSNPFSIGSDRVRIGLIIVIVAVLVGTLAITLINDDGKGNTTTDPISNDQKPRGVDLDGNPISFEADFAGKPLLVNFWASWCEPCRAEFPLLQQASKRVNVLGIVSRDTAENARRFVEEQGSTWRHVVDSGSLAAAWGAGPGLPVTFAIDADGVVRRRQFGEISQTDLDAMFDAIGVE